TRRARHEGHARHEEARHRRARGRRRRHVGTVRADMLDNVAMAGPEFEIADIIIDCSDPERLASFWGDLLGRRIEGRKGPYVWLQRPEDGAGVGFQQVAEPKP